MEPLPALTTFPRHPQGDAGARTRALLERRGIGHPSTESEFCPVAVRLRSESPPVPGTDGWGHRTATKAAIDSSSGNGYVDPAVVRSEVPVSMRAALREPICFFVAGPVSLYFRADSRPCAGARFGVDGGGGQDRDHPQSDPASSQRAGTGTKRGKPGGANTGRNLCLPRSGGVGRVGLEPTAYGLKVGCFHIGLAILVSPDTALSILIPILESGNAVACRSVPRLPSQQRAIPEGAPGSQGVMCGGGGDEVRFLLVPGCFGGVPGGRSGSRWSARRRSRGRRTLRPTAVAGDAGGRRDGCWVVVTCPSRSRVCGSPAAAIPSPRGCVHGGGV